MLFMERQLPYIYTTTFYHHCNTHFGISNKKIATYDKVESTKLLLFTLYI